MNDLQIHKAIQEFRLHRDREVSMQEEVEALSDDDLCEAVKREVLGAEPGERWRSVTVANPWGHALVLEEMRARWEGEYGWVLIDWCEEDGSAGWEAVVRNADGDGVCASGAPSFGRAVYQTALLAMRLGVLP